MTTEAPLYRLLTWLSSGYPVGAFSYSHGLEWAVESGVVRTHGQLVDWLATILRYGGGWTDAVLLAHAHRATLGRDQARWRHLRALAASLASSAELALETRAQGAAFAGTSLAVWADAEGRLAALLADEPDQPPLTYPLAVAAVAACHALPLAPTLLAYLHAWSANLVSAAVRLVPLGQTDGQRALAALEPVVTEVAKHAARWSLDELGSATLVVDLCSMRHETQYTRLFRS